MAIGYKIEELLGLLHGKAPALADALAISHQHVEYGLLSIGLKLHWNATDDPFAGLVDCLNDKAQESYRTNKYRRGEALPCLVLPPVGNVRAAILLLRSLEQFIGMDIFGNPKMQIQVCSPGWLDGRRCAMLGIGFYLSSPILRHYASSDFETTFTAFSRYSQGKRLILRAIPPYGEFKFGFAWWRRLNGGTRVIDSTLPFVKKHRRDVLIGHIVDGRDLHNINLFTTLLVHSEYQEWYSGYWAELGKQFERDMENLLIRHQLSGLLEAPWLWTDKEDEDGDFQFDSALQELMAYAFQEAARHGESGILDEMQVLVREYRDEIRTQSLLLDTSNRGDPI